MVTANSVKSKLQELIDLANDTTGGTDTTLSTAIASLISGFGGGSGSGGNAIQIGQATPINILKMFHVLETGTAKYGEFTISSYLPATETLIFSSGLEEIKGFMIIDTDWEWDGIAKNSPEFTVFMLQLNEGNTSFAINNSTVQEVGDVQRIDVSKSLIRSTTTIDGGDLYVKANFGGNSGYTPLMINHRYIWVAW